MTALITPLFLVKSLSSNSLEITQEISAFDIDESEDEEEAKNDEKQSFYKKFQESLKSLKFDEFSLESNSSGACLKEISRKKRQAKDGFSNAILKSQDTFVLESVFSYKQYKSEDNKASNDSRDISNFESSAKGLRKMCFTSRNNEKPMKKFKMDHISNIYNSRSERAGKANKRSNNTIRPKNKTISFANNNKADSMKNEKNSLRTRDYSGFNMNSNYSKPNKFGRITKKLKEKEHDRTGNK